MLMQRAVYGAESLSPTQALEIGILGSAKLLRRDDIGVIAPGMAADIIAVNLERLAFAGGLHDPLAALVLCDFGYVDLSIVNGQIRVRDGQLVGTNLRELIRRHNMLAEDLVRRTEKRYAVPLTEHVWQRAFPYDSGE